MSWHLNLKCDVAACTNVQPFSFDHEGETFGDVITAVKGFGWTFEDGRARCPTCSERITKSAAPRENSNDSGQEGGSPSEL